MRRWHYAINAALDARLLAVCRRPLASRQDGVAAWACGAQAADDAAVGDYYWDDPAAEPAWLYFPVPDLVLVSVGALRVGY